MSQVYRSLTFPTLWNQFLYDDNPSKPDWKYTTVPSSIIVTTQGGMCIRLYFPSLVVMLCRPKGEYGVLEVIPEFQHQYVDRLRYDTTKCTYIPCVRCAITLQSHALLYNTALGFDGTLLFRYV